MPLAPSWRLPDHPHALSLPLCGVLTPLDVREDARLHTATLDELFRHYGIVPHYAALPEADKQALLSREIANPRPFFPRDTTPFSETTQRIIATWRMIAGV